MILTYGQTFTVGRATYDNVDLRARVLEMGIGMAMRGAQAAGHLLAPDEDGNLRSEHRWEHFEEYPLVEDENGEAVLDEDGDFIEDTSKPKIPWSRLVVEMPVTTTEGNPS